MRKHQQWFGLDVQFSALVHNLNNIFSNEHLYRDGQSMNSLPSQILERYLQPYTSNSFNIQQLTSIPPCFQQNLCICDNKMQYQFLNFLLTGAKDFLDMIKFGETAIVKISDFLKGK